MNKRQIYRNMRHQFQYLFPDFEIKIEDLDLCYDMTTLDFFIYKFEETEFINRFWVRLFIRIFRAYSYKNDFTKTPYSQEIYRDIFNSINEKYKPTNFKC